MPIGMGGVAVVGTGVGVGTETTKLGFSVGWLDIYNPHIVSKFYFIH